MDNVRRVPVPSTCRRPSRNLEAASNGFVEKSSNDRRRSRGVFSALQGWKYELLFVALSVCTMIAVASTLLHFDQAPVKKWHLFVSLNALISILITTSKASLMLGLAACLSQEKWRYFSSQHRLDGLEVFDGASRGPEGAVRLLWKLRFSSKLAIIGATLTILSLTMEPFAQQVIEIALHPIEIFNESAAYVSYVQLSDATTLSTGLIRGVLGDAGSPQYHCPSGNCTFPSFSTLGVCGSCQKVFITVDGSCSYNSLTRCRFCNYTTSLGTPISLALLNWGFGDLGLYCDNTYGSRCYSDDQGRHFCGFDQNPACLTAYAGSTFDDTAEAEHRAVKNLIAGFVRLRPYHFNSSWTESIFEDPASYDVQECGFYNCERTFENMVVSAGVPIALPQLSLDKHLYLTQWVYPNDSATEHWSMLSENASLATKVNGLNGTADPRRQNLTYGIKVGLGYDVANSLGAGLNASVSRSGELVQSILGSFNLPATVHNLSLYMTNDLIAQGAHLKVGGSTFGLENRYNIRWLWLSLPALIVFGSVLLLVSTIHSHYRSETPLWKTSNLALVLHDFYVHPRAGRQIGEARQQWKQVASSLRENDLERTAKSHSAYVELGEPSDGIEILIGSSKTSDRVAIGRFVAEANEGLSGKGNTRGRAGEGQEHGSNSSSAAGDQ